METDAKVKYRGIQIGKVESIDYAGNQAKLTLAIDSSELRYVPSNAKVRIAGTTIFGAKSVEFLEPADIRKQRRRHFPQAYAQAAVHAADIAQGAKGGMHLGGGAAGPGPRGGIDGPHTRMTFGEILGNGQRIPHHLIAVM